jgi:hypothetical protein
MKRGREGAPLSRNYKPVEVAEVVVGLGGGEYL